MADKPATEALGQLPSAPKWLLELMDAATEWLADVAALRRNRMTGVGWLTPDLRCAKCGRLFEAGHVVRADFAPNMAGTLHHTDCTNPRLDG